jgi:hypothetical protein
MNKANIDKMVKILSEVQIGFIAINEYTNLHNEGSVRRINIGFSYEKLKKDDLKILIDGVIFIPSEQYSQTDWNLAVTELKESIINPNENRSKAQTDAYLKMTENGALKYNYSTQKLYVMGLELKESKTITKEGDYPTVNSAPKTIAKNVIKSKYLKAGKIRQFIVNEISEVVLRGETLELM